MHELDGVWDGDQSFEVLKLKFRAIIWLSLRWFQLVVVGEKKLTFNFISIKITSG